MFMPYSDSAYLRIAQIIKKLAEKDEPTIPDEWDIDNHADYDVGFIHGIRFALQLIKEGKDGNVSADDEMS